MRFHEILRKKNLSTASKKKIKETYIKNAGAQILNSAKVQAKAIKHDN